MPNSGLIGRGVSDASTVLGKQVGIERCFEDYEYSDANRLDRRTHHTVTCRLVRNTSGIALLPKRLVKYKAGTNRTEVDGYVTTTANDGDTCAVVDEWLPSAGVPNNEYFWVVVCGPTLVLTSLAGDAENVISETGVLVGLTAATSQATTAGRVIAQDLTGATDVLGNQLNGGFARALSAKTTDNTNNDLLVYLSNRWK